jgi:hypothetical protein
LDHNWYTVNDFEKNSDRMKKSKLSDIFLVCAMASGAILVLILIVFILNFKTEGPVVARGVGIVGGMAAQQNANENSRSYFDAGHGYMYQVEDGAVTAVMAYAPSSYPFAFACGSAIMNGSSVNAPLVQGEVLFATYPFGLDPSTQVYPTWNRVTGEYRQIASLDDMGLDPARAQPVLLSDVTGNRIAVEKESCLTMSVAASIVTLLCLLGFGVALIVQRKVARS